MKKNIKKEIDSESKITKAGKYTSFKQKIKDNKWLMAGLVIGFINPLAAIIYSILLTSEENLKKIGQTVLIVTLIWWAVILILARLFTLR
jgi:hypothetical protein